jgi:very-short-patch-repair endonuclease
MTSEFSLTEKREFAKEMREQPTPAERALWFHLKQEKLGYRFHRQSLLVGYIVDFYCPRVKLAIEVDGSVHELPHVAAKDEQKEYDLEAKGIGLLRFPNEDVLSFSSVVLARISAELKAREALKAVASEPRHVGTNRDSSSRMPCASQEIFDTTPYRAASVPPEQRISPEDLADLRRKIVLLTKQRSMDFGRGPAFIPTTAELWEQKQKLQAWLKSQTLLFGDNSAKKLCESENATLPLRGMQVTK